MTELTETEEALADFSPGPSATLCEAREKLGLSQKEVADKLFLTPDLINHIDQGEFDRLPRAAFIRGYLRSYARVIDLNGDHIVELYEKEVMSSQPLTPVRGVTEEKVGSAFITGPVLQTGIVGLSLFFLVIGLIWWLVSDDEQEIVTGGAQSIIMKPNPQLGERSAATRFSETRITSQSSGEIVEQCPIY